MEDDWDLYAVVRGCTAHSTAPSTAGSGSGPTFSTSDSSGQLLSNFRRDFNSSAAYNYVDLFEPRRESFIEELQDLYKPFFPKSEQQIMFSPQTLPISPLSVLGGIQDLSSEQQKQKIMRQVSNQTQIQQKQQHSLSVSNFSKNSVSHNPSPRSKRRKNNLKKICHVAAESLSSDMWSWRKYGQKPIKGSPYPRGYYKCSTLKGCLARKQVERNRSDPGMFIVTYTSEHNHPMPTHRNSLAGSTRLNKPTCSPVMSPSASLSPTLEKIETCSQEDLAEPDNDPSESNLALDEDFFAGLDDFAGGAGECMSDNFLANLPFPWLATM